MKRPTLPAPTLPMYPTRRDWDDLAMDVGNEIEAFAKRMGAYAKLINDHHRRSLLRPENFEGIVREALADTLGDLQGECWNAMEEIAA